MSNKIDQAELLAEQEDMGLGLHEAPDRPQHAGNVAFTKEMMECMPDEEVPQEVKDKNKFQYKYEVKVKKVPKKLKNVAGLKEGLVGRVVEVLSDKAVMVDFWTKTSPAKFPMRSVYLDLHKTREQVEIEAGVVPEQPIKEVEQPIKEVVEPVKFDKGKPRMDLIRPEFTFEIAKGLEWGASKYGEKEGEVPNYLKGKGFYYSKIIASCLRHFYSWASGESIDKESGVHHLALAAVNLMFLFTYDISQKGIDNRNIIKNNEKI